MGLLSVYILSAYPAITEALKTFLEAGDFITICDCSDNFDSYFNGLTKNRPDILFIDDLSIDKIALSGYLRSLPGSLILTKPIVYTGSNDPLYLKKLVDSGVPGILHKKSSKEEIVEAIMIVSGGKFYFDKQIYQVY